MNKYCPICGMENLEEAGFCNNCGANLELNIPANNTPYQQEANNSKIPQYYGKTQQYTSKKSPKKIMSIIAVAVALGIAVFLILGFISEGSFKDKDDYPHDFEKIHVSGGPSANLESIVSGGNALTTPAQGHTAVYGYYLSDYRIGEISFTNVGEETFNGKQCDKIKGDGNLYFTVEGETIETDFDLDAFVTKADSILAHSTYSFQFYEPYHIDMDMTLDIDKENGEITLTAYNSIMGSTSTVIEVSEEYWDIKLLEENMYVGYVDEITYTTNVEGIETDIILRISVVNQEDITVPKGTFDDCYAVKIEQTETLTSTTATSMVWINEDGICPKMRIESITSDFGYETDMTIDLEEYYTT